MTYCPLTQLTVHKRSMAKQLFSQPGIFNATQRYSCELNINSYNVLYYVFTFYVFFFLIFMRAGLVGGAVVMAGVFPIR